MNKGSFIRTERVNQLLKEIKLEPLSSHHLPDIAKLHFKLLPWSFNGKFGLEHILSLYTALKQSPHFFGYVYYSGGQMVGFVTATTNFEETRSRLTAVYRKRLFKVLSLFLSHPTFFWAAFESKFLVPRLFRRHATNGEWLTFLADTTTGTVGPLVAMRLIDEVKAHFSASGHKGYMAQGVKHNPPAMKMYEKLGWRIVSKLPLHNIYYYSTEGGI